jgi:hypothetical protein
MNVGKSILRFALPFMARGGVIATNVIATLALAWTYAPEIFGKIVFIWNFALIFSAFLSLGVPNYLLRELSFRLNDDHDFGRLSLPTTGALILLAPALVAGGSTALLLWLFETHPGLFPEAIESAAIIPIIFLMCYLVNLTAGLASGFILTNRINYTMFARDGLPSVTLVAAIFLPSFTADPMLSLFWNFITLQAAVALLGIAALVANGSLVRSAFEARIGPIPNTLGFWGLASTNVVVTGVDVLAGGWILGARDLGHYQLVKRICNLAALPQVVVTWAIAIPIGQAFGRRNWCAMRDALRTGARLSIVSVIPLLVGGGIAAMIASRWFGYGLGSESFALAAVSLLTSLTVVVFGPGVVVAAQTHLEFQALGARIAGVVLFALLAAVVAVHDPAPAALALCQLTSVASSGVLLWRAIRRRFAIDSSIFCLFRREGD